MADENEAGPPKLPRPPTWAGGKKTDHALVIGGAAPQDHDAGEGKTGRPSTAEVENAATVTVSVVRAPRAPGDDPRADSVVPTLAHGLPRPAAPARAGAPAGDSTLFAPTREGRDAGIEERRTLRDDALALIASCEAELRCEKDQTRIGRLHYEIARIHESILANLDRASHHYGEALKRLPDHLQSIVGARRVLIARRQYDRALPLFDHEARLTGDSRRRALLTWMKARILEDRLRRPEEAYQAYRAALQLWGTELSLLTAAEQRASAAEDWSALLDVYAEEANGVIDDPRHRAVLIAIRARLLETRADDAEAAVELYGSALDLDLEATTAIDALKRLHERSHDWHQLVHVLEREVQHAENPETKRQALYRIARIHSERLGSRDAAVAALERAASLPPVDPLVVEELARLHDEAGAPEPLRESLRRLIDVIRDPRERLAVLHRIGRISVERLDDRGGAILAYENALRIDATYIPALQALASLYAAGERWADLVAMHIAEAEATNDSRRRAVAHARAADILERRLDRAEEAADHHDHALALCPELEGSRKALVRIYQDLGRHRDLVSVYERAVSTAGDDDHAIAYLFRVGDLYEGPLRDPDQAAAAYRRILDRQPGHLGALHALQRALEIGGRHRELVEALEREAELVGDSCAKAALLHRSGEIMEDVLGDRDGALARYRRVRELDPANLAVLTSLGRLYHTLGRWEDLVEVYARELELAPIGPTAVALCQKMAEIHEKEVGDESAAAAAYRRVLDLDPTHGPALHALAGILRRRGKWEELVEVIEIERDGYRDPRTRALAAYRAGEIHEERLSQPDQAIAAYRLALELLPTFRPAADGLSRLRADKNAWTDLVEALEREAAMAIDVRSSVSAWLRAGEVWHDRLAREDRAIACYEAALDRDPDHLGAATALEDLYRRAKSWTKLADLYERKCKLVGNAGAKVAALRERARVLENHLGADEDALVGAYGVIVGLQPDAIDALLALEQLALHTEDPRVLASLDARLAAIAADPELASSYLVRRAEGLEVAGNPDALTVYREALAGDPQSRSAMRGLARVGELLGDAEAISEAARHEAAITRDPTLAADLLVRSAEVRVDRLGDREGGIADLVRALELAPDHVQAAGDLVKHLRASRDLERLVVLLSRAAMSASDPERVAALSSEVARMHAEELGNIGAAIGAMRNVIEVRPDNVAARLELAGLLARNRQFPEAEELLAGTRSVEPAIRREIHLRLAAARRQLGDVKGAYGAFETVLRQDPDDRDALRQIAELQLAEGTVAAARNTVKRLLELARSTAEKVESLVFLARIEIAQERRVEAFGHLREAVLIDEVGGAAGRAYRELGRDDDEVESYVEVLEERLASFGEDRRAAGPLYLEIANVQDEALGRSEQAEITLVQGIGATGDSALRLALADRLRRTGRRNDAIDELQKLVASDPTRVEGWRHLAHAYEETGRLREAAIALAPLRVLGAVSAADEKVLKRHPPRPAAAGAGSFVSPALVAVGIPRVGDHPIATLATILVEGLGKLRTDPLERFGLSTRDRIVSRSNHPTHGVLERLATIFAIADVQLFQHGDSKIGVALEVLPAPAVLIPPGFERLPAAQQVFAIGSLLANVARGLHVVHVLPSEDFRLLVAACTHPNVAQAGATAAPVEALEEWHRLLIKGLPRRLRRPLEEAEEALAGAPAIDVVRWAEAARQSGRRVAMVVADDPYASVDWLRTSQRLADRTDAALVRGQPMIADLLGAFVGPAAMALRVASGMLA